MHCVGEEQRIRTLFLELRLEQQPATPHFVRMWYRAQSEAIDSRRSWRMSFVSVSLLVLLMVGSIPLWLTWEQSVPIDVAAVQVPRLLLQPVMLPNQSSRESEDSDFVKSNDEADKIAWRLARVKGARMKSRTSKADVLTAMASWESPTADLMHSPASEILTSLPDVSQEVAESGESRPNR